MSRDPLLSALHPGWLASLAPDALRFASARRSPERWQRRLLLSRLQSNAASAYGQAHGFARIGSVRDFQRRVPIVDHDALAPWIARVIAGEPNVLTCEAVRLMERSGGSTGTHTKLIPYTASLLADFARATHPWLFDLYRRHPALIGRPAYWSLSPVVQGERRTDGGIPIGIDDDSAYFGPLRRRVVARSLAVPSAVAHAPDFATWRRLTLTHLLRCRRLGFISVWSPTFLLALLETLCAAPEAVLAELAHARRREVAAGIDARDATRFWPELALLSCWADGPSAAFIAALARWFPGVPIQPKGLLASEGVVSIPLGDEPGALALTSHFFEFIDLAEPRATPKLAHELRPGADYSPLLTTGGGLYRYHLKDVVRCTAPLALRFVEKLDAVSDLAGEKLHPAQVEAALAALGIAPDAALLAPVTRPAGRWYCLDLDAAHSFDDTAGLARRLEAHLMTGHAYRYCRDLGQLAPLRLQRVADLAEKKRAALLTRGQRLGDIKPSALDARPLWAELFGEGAA